MPYPRRIWKDHVVTRPMTYKKASNSDGSETFTPAPGQVLQQGTPQSATNFNQIEEALQHSMIAYDMLFTSMQAENRLLRNEVDALKTKVATVAGG